MKPKISKVKLASLAKEEKALDLRRSGLSYRGIAVSMKCSLANAHKLVTRGITTHLVKCDDLSAQVVQLELDRLDAMHLGLWPLAAKGNTQAVEKCLKIMERRAALLGYDQPKKIAATNPDGTEQAQQAAFVVMPATMGAAEWAQMFSPKS